MTNTKAYRPSIPWPSDLADDMASRYASARPAPVSSPAPAAARRTFAPSGLPTPILALDVDGPLSPFRMGAKALRRGGFTSVAWRESISYRSGSTWVPFSRLDLSRRMGDALAAFSRDHDVELVWGSLWEANGNTIVGPALGLPRLPWVDFHGHPVRDLWKWPAMIDFAAGRPLAWVDDSFNEPRKVAQRKASGFDRARRNLPTLCQRVDPALGLRPSDLEAIASWVETARLAW